MHILHLLRNQMSQLKIITILNKYDSDYYPFRCDIPWRGEERALPADQEASSLRADIITTFNTKTCTPSPEVESEAHCLGHMRPWTQSTHHENNLKNITLPSSSTNSSMKSFLFDYILHHQFRFKFNATWWKIFVDIALLKTQILNQKLFRYHHHLWQIVSVQPKKHHFDAPKREEKRSFNSTSNR